MDVTEGGGLLQGSLLRHIAPVHGVRGASLLLAEGGQWRLAAAFGDTLADAETRGPQVFSPEGGGAVVALQAPGAGWAAHYSATAAGLDLVILLHLANLPAPDLQSQLAVIEAAVAWLLVDALKARHAAADGLTLAHDLGGQMLIGAARARSRAVLADQWIARLETAFAPKLTAVLWVDQDRPRLAAVSGGGGVDSESEPRSLLQDMAQAAIDRRAPVVFVAEAGNGAPNPTGPIAEPRIAALGAAQALALAVDDGAGVGAVVILCFAAPDPRLARAEVADTVQALLAEALAIQARAHPALIRQIRNWLVGRWVALIGKTAWKVKLAVALLAVVVLVAAVIPASLNPSFTARIEADDRQIVSAPFDGFLLKAPFQSGDSVAANDVLVQFDDSELRLKVTQTRSEIAEIDTKLQSARAQRDSATVRQLESRRAQSDIDLALLERQVEQARVVAARPLIVVGGDAWRRVGDRVRLGEPMLELAAPGSFRIRAYVDEDWIASLTPGLHATALLAAYPGRPFAMTVAGIGSDPTYQNGQNAFPVLLQFDRQPDLPVLDGMRGIVRVDLGRQSLLQVYTRGLQRWVARTLWQWL